MVGRSTTTASWPGRPGGVTASRAAQRRACDGGAVSLIARRPRPEQLGRSDGGRQPAADYICSDIIGNWTLHFHSLLVDAMTAHDYMNMVMTMIELYPFLLGLLVLRAAFAARGTIRVQSGSVYSVFLQTKTFLISNF